jgi:hypothetical protein
LRALLLLLLVVTLLLLWCSVGSLTMHMRIYEQRAWRVLGVEGLVLVWGLRGLSSRLIALVLLLLARLLLRLQPLSLVVVGAILRYPALGSIAPLGAYPVEWGPVLLLLLLLLLRVGDELLLWVLRVLRVVLWWYLRLVACVLLQERVEVVLVLLSRGGQMRTGALMPLLAGVESLVLLQLLLC